MLTPFGDQGADHGELEQRQPATANDAWAPASDREAAAASLQAQESGAGAGSPREYDPDVEASGEDKDGNEASSEERDDDAEVPHVSHVPHRSARRGRRRMDDGCEEDVGRHPGGGIRASSPHAAAVPHLARMPGLRGPRPAPALGIRMPPGHMASSTSTSSSTNPRYEAMRQQVQGPLGHLINWLDEADVGDVIKNDVAELIERNEPVEWYNSDLDEDSFDEAGAQDFEEVPSDKDVLPRAPPLAPSAVPLMRPLTPEPMPRDALASDSRSPIAGYCTNSAAIEASGHNEEEEWLARQRLTGAIGRLVRYAEADAPKDDILGLRCTRRGRIMVTAVRENGIAMKAGVVAGDELVSIDGRKEFTGHPAHVVHASLRGPVTLVFLGFVGKLQAEVRVKRPPEPRCGLPPGTDVVTHGIERSNGIPQVQLCDAVVFQQDNASILIATEPSEVDASSRDDRQSADKTAVMYELQREDARSMLVQALGVVETTASL